jgi:hypothetical protein
MNVRIAASYYVACRDINHHVVLICEEGLDTPVDDLNGGPAGKKDGALAVNRISIIDRLIDVNRKHRGVKP